MKTKAIIICLLIVAQIGSFAIKANCQIVSSCLITDSCLCIASKPYATCYVIGDETTLRIYNTYAAIETNDEYIFLKIYGEFHFHIRDTKKITFKNTEGAFDYTRYILFISKKSALLIKKWAVSNLNK